MVKYSRCLSRHFLRNIYNRSASFVEKLLEPVCTFSWIHHLIFWWSPFSRSRKLGTRPTQPFFEYLDVIFGVLFQLSEWAILTTVVLILLDVICSWPVTYRVLLTTNWNNWCFFYIFFLLKTKKPAIQPHLLQVTSTAGNSIT